MLLSIVTRYFDEWFSSPPNEEETTVESTELNQLIRCTRLTILGMCLIENLPHVHKKYSFELEHHEFYDFHKIFYTKSGYFIENAYNATFVQRF